MARKNNRYPQKNQSLLRDGTPIEVKYSPNTEESPKAWDAFVSQEKYNGIKWEEGNVPVLNEVIKAKGISA